MLKTRHIEKIEDIKSFKDLTAFGVKGWEFPDDVTAASEVEIVESIKAALIEIRDGAADPLIDF